MGLSLKNLGQKITDLIGGTDIQAGQRSINDANAKIAATPAPAGVLAAPQAQQQFAQQQGPGNTFNPISQYGIDYGRAAYGALINPFVKGAQEVTEVPRLGNAMLHNNDAAVEASRQRFGTDFREGPLGIGLHGIVAGISSLPTHGAIGRVIKPTNPVTETALGPQGVPTVQQSFRQDRASGQNIVHASLNAAGNTAGDILSIIGATDSVKNGLTPNVNARDVFPTEPKPTVTEAPTVVAPKIQAVETAVEEAKPTAQAKETVAQAGADAGKLAKATTVEPTQRVEVPKIKSSRTMELGKPGVRGDSSSVYNTDDTNLQQIMRSSIIAAKGTAKTAVEHASALEEAGFTPDDVKAIRDYAVKSVGNKGAVDSVGLRSFIEDRLSPKVTEPGAPPISTTEGPAQIPTQVADTTYNAPKINHANTGMPEVDKAINDFADRYNATDKIKGKVSDIVANVKARQWAGRRLGNKLIKAFRNNLTAEELVNLDRMRDGAPTVGLPTIKTVKVYNAVKALDDQGLTIRQAIDPKVGKVDKYSSRILASDVGNAIKSGATKVKNKITGVADLNTDSPYSKHREMDKFTGTDGTPQIGTPKMLGLKDAGGGKYQDAEGNIFNRTHATKGEITAATGVKYEDSGAVTTGDYHADTHGLQARAQAIQELSTNPNEHGLYTQAQVDNGVAPKGVQQVTGAIKDSEGSPLFASKSDAKQISRGLGFSGEDSLPWKVFDAAGNIVTQAVVLNPLRHTVNQLYQGAIAAGNLPGMGNGWFKAAKAAMTVSEDDMQAYLEKSHSPTFGSTQKGFLAKVTGGASKLNTKFLASTELHIRAGLYKASLEDGMSSEAAIKNIDTFLGDGKAMSDAAHRTTLFLHYFKTMGNAMVQQGTHPLKNAGSIVSAAELAAVTAAIAYGYQKATGNPNASYAGGGEISKGKEFVSSAKDLAKGQYRQAAGPVTNLVHPILKEGVQQLFNQDLFTGSKVDETKPVTVKGHTISGRVAHALSTLVAPVDKGASVAEGKKSVAETLAAEFGFKTPHATGYQAAPNISALNTKGAITEKTGDPTGYQQQTQHFDNIATAQKSLKGDKASSDAFAKYLDRSRDPNTGQAIQNSPSESQQNALAFYSNDKLRNTVQKLEQSEASHDPVWDLSPDKLKVLQQYKGQFTGDAGKATILAANPWITDAQKASEAFYSSLPQVPGGKGSVASSQTPTYPTFDADTTTALAAYNSASPDEKANLIAAKGGELSTAFNQIAQWTNAMRRAEGAPEKKDYPVADAATQKILATYNALPKGDGPQGGSPTRAAWINANPDAYAKMQNYLTQTSVQSLISNAALAQFKGTDVSQQLLKDIKNVGQYDVAATTDANGNKFYSIDPALAYSQNQAANSSFNANYASSKVNKYLGNSSKFMVRTAGKYHVSKPTVTLKKGRKGASSVKFKVAVAKPKKGKVTLRA